MQHLFKRIIIKINYLLWFIPTLAFADGDTPVGEGLSYLINAMYGTTGIALSTLAVMVVGLLCLGHYLKWTALGYTIGGMGIMFGAGGIVKNVVALVHNL